MPRPAPTPCPPDRKLVILDEGWGHARSIRERRAVDPHGRPLPWYTYATIEYLGQLDFSRCALFEWGAGSSSLYWSERCARVVSIERNAEWHADVKAQAPAMPDLWHIDSDPDYADAILAYDPFDVIVIDGERRRDCAARAVKRRKAGGLIILDNSDWYIGAASYLREQGLVQVDFTGFGPVNNYTWTTSLYFEGRFDLQPRFERLPMPGVGAVRTAATEDQESKEQDAL